MRRRQAVFTAAAISLTVLFSVAVCVALVLPMTLGQWESLFDPPWQRLLVGVISGVIASPVVSVALRGKKPGPAIPILVAPAFAASAAALIVNRSNIDYIFFDLGVPMLYVGALLVLFCAPSMRRDRDPNACIHCGYDRRANLGGPCPECGRTEKDPVDSSKRVAKKAARTVAILLALGVSVPAQFLFCRWLLSLG